MKTYLLLLSTLGFCSPSFATEIQCHWDAETAAPCATTYDMFMSESVCFKGSATNASKLLGTQVKDDAELRYLEIQVINESRLLVFVSDAGTERLIRINQCAQ